MARTVGVEEEFLLIHSSHARHVDRGDEVTSRVDTNSGPGHTDVGLVEHEMKRDQAESASTPHESMTELDKNLRQLRRLLAESAQLDEGELVALGTSPMPVRSKVTGEDRYLAMAQQFGLLAQQQLTCATHVHVSIESREEGLQALNRIRPWAAVLTALSANSPYWQGEDTGYASYRSVAWGMWPTAGPTPLFDDIDAYDAYVGQLIASGAAIDEGMIYFDLRLSAHHPTLEFRVSDVCSRVGDAVVIAALCRALFDTAAREWREGVAPRSVEAGLLRAAGWRAARFGLTDQLVDPEHLELIPAHERVAQLMAHVDSALIANGDLDVVRAGLGTITESGTGAEQQRHAFTRRGSLVDVIADAAARTVS